MTPADLDSRRALLMGVAERLGCIVPVSKSEAESWRREWRHHLASSRPKAPRKRAPRPRKPAGPRNNPPRAAVPSPELIRPGAWVAFRPHNRLSCPETVGQVVAYLPAGVPVSDAVPDDMLRHLERHSVRGGSQRLSRVVLSIPGSRRSLGVLRTVLTGALAARGRVVPPPVEDRLLSPLPPGTMARWSWHSSKGKAHHEGRILGYVPAGKALSETMPDLRIRHGVVDISNQDRYVVKLTEPRRKKIMTPAAHLIERDYLGSVPLLEDQCAI